MVQRGDEEKAVGKRVKELGGCKGGNILDSFAVILHWR